MAHAHPPTLASARADYLIAERLYEHVRRTETPEIGWLSDVERTGALLVARALGRDLVVIPGPRVRYRIAPTDAGLLRLVQAEQTFNRAAAALAAAQDAMRATIAADTAQATADLLSLEPQRLAAPDVWAPLPFATEDAPAPVRTVQ